MGPLFVLRTPGSVGEAIGAYKASRQVVCGRCKTPINFMLEDDEAAKEVGYCSVYCPKEKSHVSYSWNCINPRPFWEGFEEAVQRHRGQAEIRAKQQDTPDPE